MTTSDFFLFVSHVSEDRSAATDIVGELERRGVPCWIAPRNIRPGKPFDDEIAEAIDASRAMLLIFSERCNESEYIRREVTVAGEAGKVIIPFRIENAQPRKGLRVRLSDLHWIDGFVSRERAIDELVNTFHSPSGETAVKAVTSDRSISETDKRERERSIPQAGRSSWAFVIAATLAAVSAAAVFLWVKIGPPTPVPQPMPAPAIQSSPAPIQALPTPAPTVQPSAAPIQALPTPVPTIQPSPAVTQPLPMAAPVPAPSDAFTPLSLDRERVLKPKDTFRECSKCPEMVVIPAGTFTMGSPANEQERRAEEGPQRKVTFTTPFVVGKFSLTFDEWDACVADGGCAGYRPDDMGWGRGRQPVINVSWDDAKAYVAWLAKKTGKPYRLLSEAEREYVTRGGTTTPFWWGTSIWTNQANYAGIYIYGNGLKGLNRAQTVPVDSFVPNPWGLYQVHGNVLEWTEDCYRDSYQGAPTHGSAWTFDDCSRRVSRGGGWRSIPSALRSAARNGRYSTDARLDYVGFRVARALSP